MVGTRTPFRISFTGGGSDLRAFYSKVPGCVVSTTINKYMYLFAHKYFEDKIQIKYSITELVDSIEKIKHPIVKEILTKFNINGIDINSIADIPAGTGLGSSSSFTVGLLNTLYSYCSQYASSEKLAYEACKIEIDNLNEPIGKQDQYAAAYGGLNFITFHSNEDVLVEPILLKSDKYLELETNLLMFYTGHIRSASQILLDQKNNIEKNKKTFNYLIKMTELAEEMKKSLINSNLADFGYILNESWTLKKLLTKNITANEIDYYYEKAINNGAIGGKLLGAGGGGFLLFYCVKENHASLRNALSDLKEIKFKFERSGSRLIYVGDIE